jgi:hypothetical protein
LLDERRAMCLHGAGQVLTEGDDGQHPVSGASG